MGVSVKSDKYIYIVFFLLCYKGYNQDWRCSNHNLYSKHQRAMHHAFMQGVKQIDQMLNSLWCNKVFGQPSIKKISSVDISATLIQSI